MAREIDLIRERRNSEIITREITESTHSDGIKDVVVNFLRDIFSRDPIYTYVEDQEIGGPDFSNTEIVITDVYTYDIRFLPAVTIRFNSASTRWVGFTQSPFARKYDYAVTESGEFVLDGRGRKIPIYEERYGSFNSSISVKVSALDTISREELINRLHIAFIEIGRDFLYTQGVFVDKEPTVGAESETELYNDYIYEQTLEVPIYSEWVRRIPLPLDKVQKIAINQAIMGYDGYGNSVIVSEDMTSAGEDIGTSTNTEGTRTIISLTVDTTVIESAPIITEPDVEELLDTKDDLIVFNPIEEQWKVTEYWINLVESIGIEFSDLKAFIEGDYILEKYRSQAQLAGDLAKEVVIEGIVEQQGRRVATGDIILSNNTTYIRQLLSSGYLVMFRRDKKLEFTKVDVELDSNLDVIEVRFLSMNRSLKARPNTYGNYDLFTNSEVFIESRVDLAIQGTDYSSIVPEDLFLILVHGMLTSDNGPLQMFGSGVVDNINEPRFVSLEYTFSQIKEAIEKAIEDIEQISGSFATVAKDKLQEIERNFTALSLKVRAVNSSLTGYLEKGELRPL